MLHGVVDINCQKFLKLAQSSVTRGDPFKLCKLLFLSAVIASTFWHRTINMWNALPENIVAATSLAMFKARLNDFDVARFTAVF